MEAARQAKKTNDQLRAPAASKRAPVMTRKALNTHSCGNTEPAFSICLIFTDHKPMPLEVELMIPTLPHRPPCERRCITEHCKRRRQQQSGIGTAHHRLE